MVFYSVLVYVEPDVYDMRQEIIYICHINAFDNKQDTASVLSLTEVILKCIKRIFLDKTRVILQSENARSYQNAIVPFFIHMLSISTGIFFS